MREYRNISQTIDWTTVILYITMVIFGWLNIYAAVYDAEAQKSIFDLSENSGKQLIWIVLAPVIIVVIMLLDFKFFGAFAYPIYGVVVLSLISVLLFGREVAGSKSWFELGFIRIQPAEFAKFATALAIAKYLDNPTLRADQITTLAILVAMMAVPAVLIIQQGDTGSALVFAAFVLVFYREGLPPFVMLAGLSLILVFILTLFFREDYFWYLLGGIFLAGLLAAFLSTRKLKNRLGVIVVTFGLIFSVLGVDYFIEILKPHQQARLEILVRPDADPNGVGWQVNQSKIAIGSGGLVGKGFLEGTQTKFDFVPDQSTDFIFCTVGEEHGWMGSAVIILLFSSLLFRILIIAERQKMRFSRVYAYCVASIFFFHFMVNIGMTIGIFPVIGIPLPFFSYGGSSLWSFTLLLFILVKLDAHRMQLLGR